MEKPQLHHLAKVLKPVPYYFLLLAAISVVICLLSLRANDKHMLELKQAVLTADKNNDDVQAPLRELQTFVTSHMNTNLDAGDTKIYPPIQLTYTYERLVKAQADATTQASNELYTVAQKYCEQVNSTDVSGRNRVPCIEDYVRTHPVAQPAPIQDALYKFSFVSPRWSPDLAGWSMLLAIFSAVTAIVTFIARKVLRHISR